MGRPRSWRHSAGDGADGIAVLRHHILAADLLFAVHVAARPTRSQPGPVSEALPKASLPRPRKSANPGERRSQAMTATGRLPGGCRDLARGK